MVSAPVKGSGNNRERCHALQRRCRKRQGPGGGTGLFLLGPKNGEASRFNSRLSAVPSPLGLAGFRQEIPLPRGPSCAQFSAGGQHVISVITGCDAKKMQKRKAPGPGLRGL